MYIIEIVTLSPVRMYISLSPRPTIPSMDHIWYQTWFYHIIILEVLHVLKIIWFGKESKCTMFITQIYTRVLEKISLMSSQEPLHLIKIYTANHGVTIHVHHSRQSQVLTLLKLHSNPIGVHH